MTLDLGVIKARCEALNERMSDMSELAWTLEGPNHYGLFSVYDNDGNAVSYGIRERQDFVAHARRDIPALVAEAERLEGEIKRLNGRELILMIALETIRKVSITRAENVIVGFIDHMFMLTGVDREKD